MNVYETPDYWTRKAKDEGYPARSVYKLSEMDEKFHLLKLLKPAKLTSPFSQIDKESVSNIDNSENRLPKVLDLGASPGSWTTYLLKKAAVVACDLKPLSNELSEFLESNDNNIGNSKRLTFIQGDLTSPDIIRIIESYAPFDCVFCDAAPATTGIRTVDTAASQNIVELALQYADTIVAGGNFVVKYFQGGAQQQYLMELRKKFTTAKAYKPTACRTRSFEVYLLGLAKKH